MYLHKPSWLKFISGISHKDWRLGKTSICDSSSIGRALASQARGLRDRDPSIALIDGALAQWLAQEAYIFKVGGSSPSCSTNSYLRMKVELSEYFKQLGYVNGYLIKDKDGRMDIHLMLGYGKKPSRKCISYAKYLWMSHYKMDVPDGYQVDHINNDKTDDRIENLQLLTRADNIRKSHRMKALSTVICPVCGKEFEFETRNLKFRPNPCCSRKCGGIKSRWR